VTYADIDVSKATRPVAALSDDRSGPVRMETPTYSANGTPHEAEGCRQGVAPLRKLASRRCYDDL
jgi:hypothetical protein